MCAGKRNSCIQFLCIRADHATAINSPGPLGSLSHKLLSGGLSCAQQKKPLSSLLPAISGAPRRHSTRAKEFLGLTVWAGILVV